MIKYENKPKIEEAVFYNGDVVKIYFEGLERTITTNRRGYYAICKYLNFII